MNNGWWFKPGHAETSKARKFIVMTQDFPQAGGPIQYLLRVTLHE
jgi:hypothetical protein